MLFYDYDKEDLWQIFCGISYLVQYCPYKRTMNVFTYSKLHYYHMKVSDPIQERGDQKGYNENRRDKKRNDRMLLKFRQASARQTNSFDISELLIRVVNIYTRSHFLHLDLWTPLLLICAFKIVLQRADINNKQEQTISAFKTKYTLAALLYKTPYCDFLLLVHQS